MIVYGRSHKKYVLNSMPASSSYDGATYSVEGNPDIFVKVYSVNQRTEETENKILSAVTRRADVAGLVPIDAAYIQGAFVGFVYERSGREERVRSPIQPVQPNPPRKPANKPVSFAGSAAIICILAGLALSALLYFVVFDKISAVSDPTVVTFNMKGILMIILGWILMLSTFFRIRANGNETVALIFGILGFIVGAAAAYGLVWLIVKLIEISATLIRTLLPVIVVIVIVLILFGGLFGRKK